MKETSPQLSDLELIAKYKDTLDKNYIGLLYKRYSHLVLGTCCFYLRDKDQGKDATVAIFEKLFEELRKRQVDNFKVWLSFVTRNFCISELRKKKVQLGRDKEFYKTEGAFMETGEAQRHESDVEKEMQLQELEKAIPKLNEMQKQCIELFYLQEKTYTDIAVITGYTMNEVKSHIQNGKRNLKIILSEKNEQANAL